MRFLVTFIFVFFSFFTFGQIKMINIGLYYGNKPIEAIVFTPVSGKYNLYTENGMQLELVTGEMIYISYDKNGIKVQDLDKVIGTF